MTYQTFSEVRMRAMRKRCWITATVLRANDEIWTVRFGPRGGWKRLK